MFERTLRFVTEKSDEMAVVDPFYLANVCITILAEHEARFITVYDPQKTMSGRKLTLAGATSWKPKNSSKK